MLDFIQSTAGFGSALVPYTERLGNRHESTREPDRAHVITARSRINKAAF